MSRATKSEGVSLERPSLGLSLSIIFGTII